MTRERSVPFLIRDIFDDGGERHVLDQPARPDERRKGLAERDRVGVVVELAKDFGACEDGHICNGWSLRNGFP